MAISTRKLTSNRGKSKSWGTAEMMQMAGEPLSKKHGLRSRVERVASGMVNVAELKTLPATQRLQLVEELWDSLIVNEAAVPVPAWQRDELRRRKARHEADPKRGSPWEDVKARVRRAAHG